MAKISAVDFANNVDYNRKKLIEHCGKNGIEVDENASLDIVVDANSNIMVEQNQDKFKVEFLDIDCSQISLSQYVEKGGSATIPTEIPSFDSEYLEFIEWATPCDVGFDNVQFDMVCMPRYKTKYDETLGQRPTYLICYFDETTLSPTINLNTATNTFIDWGDGTEVQQATTSNPHTYTNAGIYTIKIYGDAYKFQGSTSMRGMFSSTAYAYALIKAYFGENATLGTNALYLCYALRNVVISADTIALPNHMMTASGIVSLVLPKRITGFGTYVFQICKNLKYIIFPKNTTDDTLINTYGTFSNCQSLQKIVMDISFNYSSGSTYARTFNGCRSLTDVVLLEGVTTIGTNYFEGCTSLKNIKTPNSLTSIRANAFKDCSRLETIELPENVTTIDGTSFGAMSNLKSLTIPKRVTTNITLAGAYSLEKFVYEPFTVNSTIQLSDCYNLKEIILPDDFDNNILIKSYSLSDNILIYIFNKLKDNSVTGSARTFTLFNTYQTKLNTIYLNEFGERVPYGTEGAISLLQKIQNKNWTVSFATS